MTSYYFSTLSNTSLRLRSFLNHHHLRRCEYYLTRWRWTCHYHCHRPRPSPSFLSHHHLHRVLPHTVEMTSYYLSLLSTTTGLHSSTTIIIAVVSATSHGGDGLVIAIDHVPLPLFSVTTIISTVVSTTSHGGDGVLTTYHCYLRQLAFTLQPPSSPPL